MCPVQTVTHVSGRSLIYFKHISLYLDQGGAGWHCVLCLGIVISVGDHTSFRSRGSTRG
jgi:hypothetical protein